MENNQLQPTKLTKEMVQASLISETVKQNLHGLMQDGKKMVITRETIFADYQILMSIRDIYDYLEKRRKSEDKPERDRIKARKEGYDQITNPMVELLNRAEPILIAINDEIEKEEKEQLQAIQADNEIRSRHLEFANETTKSVVSAIDNKELVRIQRLIGTEKSKSKFYGKYHEKLSDLCDILLSLIENRKKIIKENDELLQKQKEALDKGDMALATALKEQIELNETVIRQNADSIAADAFNQISEIALMGTTFESQTITPRLRRLSYKIDDIELLYKKSPELVELEPNKKAIGELLKQKEEAGELADDLLVLPGITLYRKKFYCGVPKKEQDDAA